MSFVSFLTAPIHEEKHTHTHKFLSTTLLLDRSARQHTLHPWHNLIPSGLATKQRNISIFINVILACASTPRLRVWKRKTTRSIRNNKWWYCSRVGPLFFNTDRFETTASVLKARRQGEQNKIERVNWARDDEWWWKKHRVKRELERGTMGNEEQKCRTVCKDKLDDFLMTLSYEIDRWRFECERKESDPLAHWNKDSFSVLSRMSLRDSEGVFNHLMKHTWMKKEKTTTAMFGFSNEHSRKKQASAECERLFIRSLLSSAPKRSWYVHRKRAGAREREERANVQKGENEWERRLCRDASKQCTQPSKAMKKKEKKVEKSSSSSTAASPSIGERSNTGRKKNGTTTTTTTTER